MTPIKIFLASSSELDEDKTQFDLYFNEKNKIYRKRNIVFEQCTWKDFESSLSVGRLQDRYNRYIQHCDIAIFLFHTKIGNYTKEEFSIAHQAFLKNKGRKPKIYIYLREEETVDVELKNFKSYNEHELGHFCDTYSDYKELWIKFDKQLQLLENGKFIKSDPIDVPRMLRYSLFYILIPLLILSAVFAALNYYKTFDMTVRIVENSESRQSELGFKEGTLEISYADMKPVIFRLDQVHREAVLREIHSKYKRESARIVFTGRYFYQIDTLVPIRSLIELPIERDQSLATIYGRVVDENSRPLSDVVVRVCDLQVKTDETGAFRLSIPAALQAKEQRLTAFKPGFDLWDFTAPVSEGVPWNIVLRKSV